MLKQVMGTYLPSAFSISLNTLPQNFNKRDATFVHEYIHFIQDLLLPYCIRQNLVFINNFYWVSINVQNKKRLEIPFVEWSDDSKLTFQQTNYTWGNGPGNIHSGKIIDVQSDYFTSVHNHNIYRYVLKFEDGTYYQFGARDFLEYLAHKIENQFWETSAPDLPYRTVDRIFDYYSINFVPEAVRLLIVEYCLYNDHPVRFFINAFINQAVILNNKDKFYDYDTCKHFLLNLGWEAKGGFNESILTKTERRLNDFRERLSELYPHRQFESIQKWIITTNDFCRMELSNRFVISSFYNMEKEDLFSFIDRLLDAIGIPVIIFNDSTISSKLLPRHYDSDQFLEFYVIKKFMEWIGSNNNCCPIYDICSKNFGFAETVCKISPISFQGECKFKVFLKSYCLDNIIIVRN